MFRTLRKKFLPNPFESKLKKCAKKGGRKILLGWNRGLGDLALGIYPMIEKIRELVPNAEISFLTRPDLEDGFSLLRGIKVHIDPTLTRGKKWVFKESLSRLQLKGYDLIFPNPSPTEWMQSSRGKVVPKLEWEGADLLDLPEGFTYIGVQAVIETNYGKWRNWPKEHYDHLFARLEQMPKVRVLLLGGEENTEFKYKNIIDLRGKTTFFELLSILRYKCSSVLLPDSGILSMAYYLNRDFPIHVVSLWADPNHGVLKQGVASPNKLLKHTPLLGEKRDLSAVSVNRVMNALFPPKPLKQCVHEKKIPKGSLKGVGAIILAGGQGTRLGIKGPKGAFRVFGKSLFQQIIEKAPKENFPIAVMTSPLNHEETVSFFEKHAYFGREIYFFKQHMEPFLDEKKRQTPHLAPCGNGSVFKSFVSSSLFSLFQERGVEYVNIVPVDNPLGNPADPKPAQFARDRAADIALKCVEKEEGMGALVEREGKKEVQEYFELDPAQEYLLGNTGMMAISIPFFEKAAKASLPFHLVKKKIPETNRLGYKKEQFIFDAFFLGKVEAILYEKKETFFPVKDAICSS